MTAESIMVVDHDRDYLRLFQALAEQAGVDGYYAGSAEEAWGILVSSDCDIMMLAADLPGDNGRTLAAMAKQLCPQLKVMVAEEAPVALSAHDSAAAPPAVAKPYTAEELLQIVTRPLPAETLEPSWEGKEMGMGKCAGLGG
ncbi:response regulator [Geomonas sp.]|uniref:response regulator n=1 Tax=Geomonas sp. TaxID=2651584 RepID=UPI002B49A41A|nr:response regulator [Geomonas sp.]HJV35848.1 response regulator [Geomonas sp.]